MRKNSVFERSYGKRYYLTHPWKIFTELWRDHKAAHKRIKYGWCSWDVWDWDNWFMSIVPDQFRYLADHGCAYPGREPFETPEKWHEWLYHMADLIESGLEEKQDEQNEYYEEYMKELMNEPWVVEKKDENGNIHHIPTERTELSNKYFARAKELSDQGERNIREALTQIAEHFFSIWD